MTTRTFQFTVQSSGAPSWFTSQAAKTWTAVASSATLQAASSGQSALSGATFPTMATAWTGGCVDQVRGDLIFAANGGHDDYRGNEVYACRIKAASPAWYRLNDHTPNSSMVLTGSSTANTTAGQGWDPSNYAAMWTDGRMRAVHGWCSQTYANGRVWFPSQSSPTGAGNSTGHAWSFDRAYSGLPSAPGGSPLAWANNAGPWEWLGAAATGNRSTTTTGAPMGIPAFALDPVTGLIWTACGNADAAWMVRFGSLNTATEAIQYTSYGPGWDTPDGRWACVVYDPAWDGVAGDPNNTCRWRYWVGISPNSNGIIVLNLKAANPYATSAWVGVVSTSNTSALSAVGLGAVYHAPSRSILLGDPSQLGSSILKLRVPTNGDGTFAGGTWQVSTITAAGGGANPGTGFGDGGTGWRAYSKFNIINDMGNGQSALVCCGGVTLPTYVYKLPTTEIS
jgi:hypothetical protein